jgi:antitoxin HicB
MEHSSSGGQASSPQLPARAGPRKVVPLMSTMADDAVRHYLNLPYRIALTRDGEDDDRPWRATVEELAGCEARGATPTDAAARIPSAIADWVASAHAAGREVPEPRSSRSRAYSGRLLLRMPQSLHSDLAEEAEREQVSLNAYINSLLVAARQSGVGEGPSGGIREAAGAQAAASSSDELAHSARLQRFLALALGANVAIVAIAAAIAVILLLTAA